MAMAPYALCSICDIRGEAPTARQCLALDENSASFDLGWILEQSPAFRALLVSSLFPAVSEAGEISVLLRRHSTDGGYTDVELNAANRFHAILEARRFWTLPGKTQLRRYHTKIVAARSRASERCRCHSYCGTDCRRR
jgi:hypothetical protein